MAHCSCFLSADNFSETWKPYKSNNWWPRQMHTFAGSKTCLTWDKSSEEYKCIPQTLIMSPYTIFLTAVNMLLSVLSSRLTTDLSENRMPQLCSSWLIKPTHLTQREKEKVCSFWQVALLMFLTNMRTYCHVHTSGRSGENTTLVWTQWMDINIRQLSLQHTIIAGTWKLVHNCQAAAHSQSFHFCNCT